MNLKMNINEVANIRVDFQLEEALRILIISTHHFSHSCLSRKLKDPYHLIHGDK